MSANLFVVAYTNKATSTYDIKCKTLNPVSDGLTVHKEVTRFKQQHIGHNNRYKLTSFF